VDRYGHPRRAAQITRRELNEISLDEKVKRPLFIAILVLGSFMQLSTMGGCSSGDKKPTPEQTKVFRETMLKRAEAFGAESAKANRRP
jgi:hypothetical protein